MGTRRRMWLKKRSSRPIVLWRISEETARSTPGCTGSRSTRPRTTWWHGGGGHRIPTSQPWRPITMPATVHSRTSTHRSEIHTAMNYPVARGRRPPDSDIAAEDAEYYDGDSALKDIHSPERDLLRDEIEQVVNRTLQLLPSDLRMALILREFEGLSYEDIANVMECPVGTVRSRIFRAREAIDKALKPLLEA